MCVCVGGGGGVTVRLLFCLTGFKKQKAPREEVCVCDVRACVCSRREAELGVC